jgi:hypothetical protein
LAKLAAADRAFIDQVLAETLTRSVVLARVRSHFRHKSVGILAIPVMASLFRTSKASSC